MRSLSNDHTDNFETERFVKITEANSISSRFYNSQFITRRFLNKSSFTSLLRNANELLDDPKFDGFEFLYELLANDESKELLIDLVAYRLLGNKKVKLAINNPGYWTALDKIGTLENNDRAFKLDFLGNKSLPYFDLKPIGYDIKLNFTKLGVLVDFVLQQYCYKTNEILIEVKTGDVVIDAGGCWGDTALYFASKCGEGGKVYSFEFIPNNIKLYRQNLALNPRLSPAIEIIEHPVWETNNLDFYYVDKGPASNISMERTGKDSVMVKSKTIDALVNEKELTKVDFIKMDIEGAEPFALRGAEQTIRKFKPNLAIAIYHSISDFVSIPQYLHSLDLGYKFYLGHYTIYEEETIIFATTE